MTTKLTLRLDEKLIKRAKKYAKKTGKSVSQMVADYFSLLEEENSREDQNLTPMVQSLKGSLRGKHVEIEDYHRYLEEKYL